MLDNLINRNIILASRSPRRRFLLKQMGISFTEASAEVDETIPPGLSPDEAAVYLSEKKADHFSELLTDRNNLIVTADTLVVVEGQIIGKPVDQDDARRLLRMLSGKWHQVVTGVTVRSSEKTISFTDLTDVCFKELTEQEISYYVSQFEPYDKAGAYGAQEWIGYIGIVRIQGSYFNVMGLPVHRLYEELSGF